MCLFLLNHELLKKINHTHKAHKTFYCPTKCRVKMLVHRYGDIQKHFREA